MKYKDCSHSNSDLLQVLYQALNNMVGQQREEDLRCQQLQFLKGLYRLETVLRKRVVLTATRTNTFFNTKYPSQCFLCIHSAAAYC